MKAKKLLSLAIATSMLATMLLGCQQAPQESSTPSESSTASQSESSAEELGYMNFDGDVELNAPGEFPIVKGDKVNISVFTAPHTEANGDLSYGTNAFTTYFEDLTNVHIDWSMTTLADKVAKLNLLFQSNDYDDVVLNSSWTSSMQYSYGEQGFLIPLNEYYETEAHYFDEFVEAALAEGQIDQQMLDSMYMPDGNIYTIFGGMTGATTHTFQYKMWMYKPWLDALKLDMPTTTEEYFDVLTAFKEQDPNGNGIADEIPLSGATNGWNCDPAVFLLNSFVYYQISDYMFIDDGEIKMSYMQDELLDGIKYLRSLMDAGLYDPDTYSQDINGLKVKTTGEKQIIGCVPGGMQQTFTSSVNGGLEGDWTNFAILPPLEGPDGVQYAAKSVSYPTANVNITNNCELPLVAFRMFDALYDPVIGRNCKIGNEGTWWEYAEKGQTDVYGGEADFVKIFPSDAESRNYAWGALGNSLGDSYPGITYNDKIDAPDELNVACVLGDARNKYMEFDPGNDMIVPPLNFSEEDSKTVIDIKMTTDELYKQFFVDAMYTVEADGLDDLWAQFQENLSARNIEEYVRLYQAAYDSL